MPNNVSTSNALIGIAGVHYVAAELSRRGMVALPTTRNTAAYDIAVVANSTLQIEALGAAVKARLNKK